MISVGAIVLTVFSCELCECNESGRNLRGGGGGGGGGLGIGIGVVQSANISLYTVLFEINHKIIRHRNRS